MQIRYLLLEPSFGRPRKQGVETALALGAGVGLLGIGVSSVTAADAQQTAIGASAEENEKARTFNHNEAQLAREWQAAQQEQQMDWQQQVSQHMLDQQIRNQWDVMNYNSIGQQINRAAQAGINPLAVVGAGGYQSASPSVSSSGVSPVSSSGPAASTSPMMAPPNYTGAASMMSAFGSLFHDLASARKEGAETGKIEALLQHEIDNMKADTDLKRGNRDYIDVMTTFNQKWLPKKFRQEIRESVARMKLASNKADLVEFEKWVAQAQATLYNSETAINMERLPLISEYLETYIKKMRSEIGLNNSQSAVNEQIARIKTVEADVSEETKKQQAELIRQQLVGNQLLNGSQAVAFEMAVKANDWYTVNQVVNTVNGVLGAVNTVGSTVAGLKGAGASVKSANAASMNAAHRLSQDDLQQVDAILSKYMK